MQVRRSHTALQAALQQRRTRKAVSVGFVPTMGALHPGHRALIDQARAECDVVVVSIYVNPLQFSPHEDFAQYPRSEAADLGLCEAAGVDIVFLPMALDHTDVVVATPPKYLLEHLCGPWRPGHFEGVLTVITQLVHIVQPDTLYLGQKDAQQVVLIRHLLRSWYAPIGVRTVPTVREASGLALSSRNQYLTESERERAPQIYAALMQAKAAFRAGERQSQALLAPVQAHLEAHNLRLQYLELVDPERLQPLTTINKAGLLAVAVWLGKTRLIDNLLLRVPQAIIAIDGPAGAGKSSVGRRVAATLGMVYLDTGALYRSLTWLAQSQGVSIDDEPALVDLAVAMDIRLAPQNDPRFPTQVLVNGTDVTQAIRSQAVTAAVSTVAAHAYVRQEMLARQRVLGEQGPSVVEGRDIGTQVFPEAQLKIFLTATAEERARRRLRELEQQGEAIDLETLISQIEARDRQDRERPVSPLLQAEDAIEVLTDDLSQDQVVERIVELFQTASH